MRMSPVARKRVVLAAGVLLVSTRTLAADRQLRPFVGATFAGATTVVDPGDGAKKPSIALGGSAVFLGEIFGGEVEIADMPGFFEANDKNLVPYSRVTTVTGNVVVAAPHRLTEYALRPYVVAGAGLMRMRKTTTFDIFNLSATVPAFDIGVGAVGFLSNSVGVSWELRRFQDIGSNVSNENGSSFGPEQHLSFWRATMAFVFRY
jgi:outer membrane protein with beta-barrel domain